jgi:hypothetical protein
MSSSISYLSRQSNFKQLNENYPVTQSIPNADPEDVFEGPFSPDLASINHPLPEVTDAGLFGVV